MEDNPRSADAENPPRMTAERVNGVNLTALEPQIG
jgi:hypothetical protein